MIAKYRGIYLLIIFAIVAKLNSATAQGLVAHYFFGGNANNSTTIAGLNGTFNNESYAVNKCHQTLGAAWLTTVTGDYSANGTFIDVADNAVLRPSTEITIMAWVRSDNANAEQKLVCKTSLTGVNGYAHSGYVFGLYNGKIEGEIFTSPSSYVNMRGVATHTGVVHSHIWTHIAMTFKAGEYLIGYVNGQEVVRVDASTVAGIGASNGAPMRIGSTYWDNPTSTQGKFSYFGRVDELRIYDTKLAAADIMSHYTSTGINLCTAIAHYPLNNSGVNNIAFGMADAVNGSSAPTPTSDRCGVANQAINFNQGPWMEVANNGASNFREQFTIATWVRLDDLNRTQAFVNKVDFSATSGYWFGLTTTGVLYGIIWDDNGNRYNLNTTITSAMGLGWTHVAFTYKAGGDMVIYKNGTEVGRRTPPATVLGINQDVLYLGSDNFINDLDGRLDELYIYARQLSSSEILSLYNTYPPVTQVSTLVGISGPVPCSGGSQTFTGSTLSGSGFTLQWYKNSVPITGSTDGGIYAGFNNLALEITSIPSAIAGSVYMLSATGACGNGTTSGILTVNSNTSISGINTPIVTFCGGSTRVITFNTVSGTSLTYQWFEDQGSGYTLVTNGGIYSGANSTRLTLLGVNAPYDGYSYIGVANGTCGSMTSTGSSLSYIPPPSISGPDNITTCKQSTVTYFTTISGAFASMRWLYSTNGGTSYTGLTSSQNFGSGNAINGSAFMQNLGVDIGNNTNIDNYYFALSVNGVCANITSVGASLTVQSGPSIQALSSLVTTCGLSNAAIGVTASGTSLTYRWYKGTSTTTGTLIDETTDGGTYGNSFTTAGLNITNIASSLVGTSLSFVCQVGSACGGTVTGVAVLSVLSPPVITVQPPSTVSTCLGLNFVIPMAASGYVVGYQWAVNKNDGFGFVPITGSGVGFSVTGFNSNTLNIFSAPLSISGFRFLCTVMGLCAPMQVSDVTTVQINSGPVADFFNLQPSYCTNEGTSQLTGITSLTFAGGTFVKYPIAGPNPLSAVANGQATFNPNVFSAVSSPIARNITISYITPPTPQGCVTTVTYASFINTVSGILLTFTSPSENAYPSNTTLVGDLVVSTSGITGSGVFSGNGVILNQFFPPIAGIGSHTILYTFTQTFTGCVVTISRNFNVFNPSGQYFTFSPTPAINAFTFCATDNSLYNITYNGTNQTAEEYYAIYGYTNYTNTVPSYCLRNHSITISGVGGIYGTTLSGHPITNSAYDMNSFQLNPSVVGINTYGSTTPRSYALAYMMDYGNINGNCFTAPRTLGPFRTQTIVINPKPTPPNMSQYTVNVCAGAVTNFSINASGNGFPSPQFKWYSYTNTVTAIATLTGSSATLAQLNINNSTPASPIPYRFWVSILSNSCEGERSMIEIFVRTVPSDVTIVPSNVINICQFAGTIDTTLTLEALTMLGVVNTYWYANSSTGLTFIGNKYTFNQNTQTPTSRTVYARYYNGLCFSPQYAPATLHVNPSPGIPDVIKNIYACQTNPIISLTGNAEVLSSPVPLRFKWYVGNPQLGSSTFVGFGTTSIAGIDYINVFNSGITNADTIQKTYYVKAVNSITGCENADRDAKEVTFHVNNVPEAPSVSNIGPLCNNLIGVAPSFAVNNPDASSVYKWYSNSSLTGLPIHLGNNFPNNIPLNAAEDTTFYVVQESNNCVSSITAANLVINPPIAAPNIDLPVTVSFPGYYCQYSYIPYLTMSGFNTNVTYKWYAPTPNDFVYSVVGTNIMLPTDLPAFPVVGTKTYHITQKLSASDGGCEGASLPVTFHILPQPNVPVTYDYAYCVSINGGNIVADVNGVSQPNFSWYDQNFSFLGVGTNQTLTGGVVRNTFTHNYERYILDSTYYYVDVNIQGCYSNVNYSKIAVYNSPPAPITSDAVNQYTYCSGSTINILEISTNSGISVDYKVRWYSDAQLNTMVGMGLSLMPAISPLVPWVDENNYQSKDYYAIHVTHIINDMPRLTFAGCNSTPQQITVRVNPLPPPPVFNYRSQYCSGDQVEAITLTGVNSPLKSFQWYISTSVGAVFNADIFLPAAYISNNVSGINPVQYTFFANQSYNGCTGNFGQSIVTYNPLPVTTFTGMDNAYCEYSAPITISGNQLTSDPGTFTSVNLTAGSYNSSVPDKFIITPSLLGTYPQYYNFNYSYRNLYGCSTTASGTFLVNARPVITFTGLPVETCFDAAVRYNLFPGPGGGVFSMVPVTASGVSGSQFIPNLSGYGLKTVRYTYTDPATLCLNTSDQVIDVHPLPIVNFNVKNLCQNDSVQFNNISTVPPPSSFAGYSWFLSSGDTSTHTSPRFVFAKPGSYDALLIAQTNFGCSGSTTIGFNIGARPNANFLFSNICNGESTAFRDQSTIDLSSGVINRWSWDFGISGTDTDISTAKNPTFKYDNVGAYQVSLTVTYDTTDTKCANTITKTINTIPKITSFPYFEDFNSNNGNWFADGSSPTWQYGQADKNNIKYRAPNDKFWVTALSISGVYDRENGYINGPCFDFGNVAKPMISLDINYLSQDKADGAVLQYSSDGGNIWKVIGNQYNSGSYYWKWYTHQNIFADPGDQPANQNEISRTQPNYIFPKPHIGWSGNSKGWINARHSLDSLSGKNNVRIRIAYAKESLSDTIKAKQLDGFAFDNLLITQRTRMVLVENFTNATLASNDYKNSKNMVEKIINQYKDNAIALQYHMAVPAADEFNITNASDPAARSLFYNIQSAPKVALDGNTLQSYYGNINYSIDSKDITPLMVEDKSMEFPKAIINLSTTQSGDDVKIDFSATATQYLPATEYIFYIVAVEREVSAADNSKHEMVVRKMLPSAAGTSYFDAWNAGETRTVNETWKPVGIKDKSQMGIVAFVQNKSTKEILQSAYFGPKMSNIANTLVGINEVVLGNDIIATIMPNPATDKIFIHLSSPANNPVIYQIFDIKGTLIISGQISEGNILKEIPLSNIQKGLYLVKMAVGSKIFTKKLVVE
ncbi:MAG: LamG-like jellyroll fold domain-containing protein [Cytophagales bacterium]|nr:LamG-like jellyroll fold domain-containing protein [Cytophagales bacterium]